MTSCSEPHDSLVRGTEKALGRRPVGWRRPRGSGYGTNTSRWIVDLEEGGSAFVKVALDDVAVGWLRREHNVYASVRAPFVPALVGWHDEDVTLLALEDLSDAEWPPPWDEKRVEAVLASLADLRATPPPDGLRVLEEMRDRLDGWPRVADDPAPFLSLGLCSADWLAHSMPVLAAASAASVLDGDQFLHLDVRSDNLCLRDGHALFIDWNWASVGNALLDVVGWLPSLRLEGGPEPETIISDSGGLAALLAGFFLSQAGLPPPATAPKVREIQRLQGEVALTWAARELALPDLDSEP